VTKIILLPILALVLILSGCRYPPEPAAPTTTTTNSTCDPSLWQHVYHPYRLRVVRQCLTVEGVVTHVAHERDGDVHIRLLPDGPWSWTLRPANYTGQHGDLVLEPVCVRTPTQASAVEACTGYRSPLTVPTVGEHVRVTGAYVYDLDHGGWAELHPVTTIERG